MFLFTGSLCTNMRVESIFSMCLPLPYTHPLPLVCLYVWSVSLFGCVAGRGLQFSLSPCLITTTPGSHHPMNLHTSQTLPDTPVSIVVTILQLTLCCCEVCQSNLTLISVCFGISVGLFLPTTSSAPSLSLLLKALTIVLNIATGVQ